MSFGELTLHCVKLNGVLHFGIELVRETNRESYNYRVQLNARFHEIEINI